MKHHLWITLITLIFQSSISQTIDNEKAHRRYWFYRARIINDFMKIGKEQGACIVLAQRNNGEDNVPISLEKESKVGPDQIDITNMYIMALALEYKLLCRNHQDTRETIKELYHMLYTINRLDLEAEQFFSPGMVPTNELVQQNGLVNGFILREDMPRSFFTQNKEHFNYGLLERSSTSNDPDENYGGFSGLQHTNDLTIDNKFSGFFTGDEVLGDLTLVVDKYMSMLNAMMFVTKYIPLDEYYGNETFQNGNRSIRQEAVNIANRCYGYLRNKNNLWRLHYQDINGLYLAPLNLGNQAYLYSFPLSRMVCWANGMFPWSESNPFACSNYNDFEVTTFGQPAYNGFTMGTISCAEDNAVFKAWCQAGSNMPSRSNVGTFTPIYIGMSSNTAYNSIEWADLLRKVLHQDGALLKQLSVYGNAINQAPCQGPYNYGNCTHGGWEWSSQDRLEHPSSRGFACNGDPNPVPCTQYIHNSGFQGNYPGVDYMLLHNLYYEYQNQVLDGHQGNVGFTPLGNAVTTIFNNFGNAIGIVNSALCSSQNALGGVLQGNSTICDPTIIPGGNIDVSPYHAYNYMDNRDENIWPRRISLNGPPGSLPVSLGSPIPNHSGHHTQGIDGSEAKVAVFQNLSSNAKIFYKNSPAAPGNNIPSNVTYRAGKEIILEPGFEVENGSTFRAFVQRYLCNGNSDPLLLRQAKDSSELSEYISLDYENDQINPIPIHYVENPKSDADNHPVVSEEGYNEDYLADMVPLGTPRSSEFLITPNPTSGKFSVQTKKMTENEKFSIHVFDMKGRLIYEYNDVTPEFEINLEGYSKGIYMVQVVSDLGNSLTKKIDVVE